MEPFKQFPSGAMRLAPRTTPTGAPPGWTLENISTHTLADGCLCWVQSSQADFRLFRNSVAIPDGVNVIASATGGPGRWIRSDVSVSITVDADYTAVPPFYVIFVSGVLPPAVPGPARTITLPAVGVLDSEYTVKDVTGTAALATPIIVDGNGALIDGVATRQITAAYGSLHMKFDGTEWRIL